MIHQTKVLKTLLKNNGIKRRGKLPSVRTKKTPSGEWGQAVSHTDALTDDQITLLKKENEYLEIYNNIEHGFAIIKH